MLVLGIETSCDETAAALVRDGREIVSSVIASQIETHKRFGGVVPELASREHLDKIVPIVEEAFTRANMTKEEIDGIAVTVGPGLVGSLLVGVSYAKAMAFALQKPLVGVNHIEGHIYSVAFENPPVEYPALALIVSGGHTQFVFRARSRQVQSARAHARRCGRRSIRQGGEDAGTRLSRWTNHRTAGARRKSKGGEVFRAAHGRWLGRILVLAV